MRIAICDDQICIVKEIMERIESVEIIDVLPNVFDKFTDPNQLLEKFKKEPYDLVYLDIEMGKDNGIAIANKIKEMKASCMIIFITNYDKYIHKSYWVEAFQYIQKPIDDKVFTFELKRAIRKYKTMNKFILFHTSEGNKYVKTSDIICLLTRHPSYKLYLTNDQTFCGKSRNLKKAKEELIKNHFFKLSRSIFINFTHVDTYDVDRVNMINKKRLPLSRLRQAAFKKAYFDFIDKENNK